MNLHERVLSVLGCRFVDDVLIDAPWNISHDMMASLKISEVVYGSRCDGFQSSMSKSGFVQFFLDRKTYDLILCETKWFLLSCHF